MVEDQYTVALEVHFLVVVHCHLVLLEVLVDCLVAQDLLVLIQNLLSYLEVEVLSEVVRWWSNPDCKRQR